ncbi:MAG: DUF58 domain-containing protein [Saprospiraceae bacterium]|nr:DUF58 domain-containing protein [Saprospiraceae bacterium]HMW40134.1 DUF58 domain-containing protein [Saprospiraceae bacterium]HMX89242.1 DUF58 domain-containing protein [Saprospiraceae bacterium]HMZ40301.1 DUF58 domain-containing protein [Saprospiraceae bacterium]HNA63345.1 DUF58 domain-containing protein [Saprospiraceae bacterium]
MQEEKLLSKVRRIEIKTRGLSRHLFSGAYHSVFKGRGMSFSEVREYHLGDDIRHIDWNVTARSSQPYVKIFEEERELSIVLMIDISRSTWFGSTTQSKAEWIAEIASVLAFSASQNHDKVGLVLFSDRIHLYIPPRKGRQNILRLIREILVERQDAGETDLQQGLEFVRGALKKRSVCFVLSDFHVPLPEGMLRQMALRHDLICMQILDPLEEQIPDAGLIPIRDAERNVYRLFDSTDPDLRHAHSERVKKNNQLLKSVMLRAGAEFIALDVRNSYIKVLLNFFKSRKR